MIMRTLVITSILSLIFLFSGCTSMIRPEKTQPVFYLLQTQADRTSCSQSFNGGLRIWDFETSEPFNRTQMAVIRTNGTIVFSRKHQWAALPGIMLAESLQQDFSQNSLFPLAVKSMTETRTSYELTGRIKRFCLKQKVDTGLAEIKAEIILQTSEDNEVVFHKTYSLNSHSIPLDEPSKYVKAISKLTDNLYRRLQVDLCQVAKN